MLNKEVGYTNKGGEFRTSQFPPSLKFVHGKGKKAGMSERQEVATSGAARDGNS